MSGKKSKVFIILLASAGIISTTYGMLQDKDSSFIAGIMMVSLAYGLLRKALKNKGDPKS